MNSQKVSLRLLPESMFREILSTPFSVSQHPHYKNLDTFERFSFELKSRAPGDPEDIAEEVFDVMNNPSRINERNSYVGRNTRSLSIGDVVEIDGVFLTCDTFGWQRLEVHK